MPFTGKTTRFLPTIAICALVTSALSAQPFPYQGRLDVQNQPAQGAYDFIFSLNSSPTGAGTQIGSPAFLEDVPVQNGLFSTQLNFGDNLFTGQTLYLQISVREGTSTGTYTPLDGRVPILPVPMAYVAKEASTAANAATLGGLTPSAFALNNHRHSSLSAPDGAPTNVLEVQNDGEILVNQPMEFGAITLKDSGHNFVLESPSAALNINLSNSGVVLQPRDAGQFLQLTATDAPAGANSSGPSVIVSAGDAPPSNDGSGGAVSLIAGNAPHTGLGAGGNVLIQAGTGPNNGEGQGGGIFLNAGNGGGLDSGTGGTGGTLTLNAGNAQGTGNNNGGSITLRPGASTGTGNPGSINATSFLAVNTEAAPQYPLDVNGAARISGPLHDSTNSPGTPGDVLTSTQTGIDWVTPRPRSIFSPLGNPVLSGTTTNGIEFLETDYRSIFRNSVEISNGVDFTNESTLITAGSTFRLKLLQSELEFLRDNFGNLFIRSVTNDIRQINFGPVALFENGSANNGANLRLFSGDADPQGTGAGGTLFLSAGRGGGLASGTGGPGGGVVIAGGDAYGTSSNNGGDIYLLAGNPSGNANQGTIRATGNISLNTNAKPALGRAIDHVSGAHLTVAGVWQNASDIHSKTDFQGIDPQTILQGVLNLPVQQWRYKVENQEVKHLGPTAQDFQQIFGLGNSETSIGTVDADGVALAAIQGLHLQTSEELQNLKKENTELRQRLDAMEALLQQLASESAKDKK
jgi:hypothetical protein